MINLSLCYILEKYLRITKILKESNCRISSTAREIRQAINEKGKKREKSKPRK